MTKVRLAAVARDDLRDIRRYSKAVFGPRVAREYLAGLNAVFILLRDRPYAGAVEEDLGSGMRSFAHRSHLVYYKAGSAEVVIVRILHHARDARQTLMDDQ